MKQGLVIGGIVVGTIAVFVLVLKTGAPPPLEIPPPRQDTDAHAGRERSSDAVATAWVTLSPHCPISNSCIPTLNRLHTEYTSRGVRIVGVVPGAAATLTETNSYVQKYDIHFEIIHDAEHKICRQLNVTHTPQVVLIDADGGRVYSGRIDDRYTRIAGSSRAPRDETLRRAIDSLMADTVELIPDTQPVGCLIEQPRDSDVPRIEDSSDVTFNGDVAPIIYRHCARCHRPGEAAPFSLLTCSDVTLHAKQIVSVVERRLMPPWKPAIDYGHFRNEARLSDAEISTLTRWVQSGCRRGASQQPPAVPEFPVGWQLGTPDAEFILPADFEVPADGPDIYQHFVIPTGLTSNRLIRAFEFRPGSPDVVHHAFVYFDTTGEGRRLDAETPEPGYSRIGTPGFVVSGSLGGWGPGGLPRELPAGTGRPLPANSDLVVQIHYHPTGRTVSDRSRIGLYFADPTADRLATEIMVADVNLRIPAGAENHHHRAEWTLPVDTYLLDATPHMHTLGRRIQAQAVLPDGETVPLIRIDDWDFYWQDSYVYDSPIGLPAGTRILLDCWFDNSSENKLNPNDPPRTVRWGDFSDDEMGICYFRVTTDDFDDYARLNRESSEYFRKMWEQYQTATKTKAGVQRPR